MYLQPLTKANALDCYFVRPDVHCFEVSLASTLLPSLELFIFWVSVMVFYNWHFIRYVPTN